MRYQKKKRKGQLVLRLSLLFCIFSIGFLVKNIERIRQSEVAQVESQVSQGKGQNITVTKDTITVKDTLKEAVSLQNYAYACLNEEEKAVYDQMYDAIMNFKKNVTMPTLQIQSIERAYEALCSDYGNLFWTEGYGYTKFNRGERLLSIEFTPQYTMTQEEKEKKQNLIDVRVEEMLQDLSPQASEYEKVKYVYETLITNVDYVVGCKDNQNICSVFLYGETVCQGYAGATQYLLKKLGINSSIILGVANGESHAWNLVLINGSYSYVDTTWGNSSYLDITKDGEKKFTNYNFLGITTEELLKTHRIIMDFPVPECTDIANNYYVQEGLYFETDDIDQIGTFIAQKKAEGMEEITLKFSTKEIYETVVLEMLTNKRIMDYCKEVNSLYYVENSELNVLRLYLK